MKKANIVVIGKTGAGKTTLIDVILRKYGSDMERATGSRTIENQLYSHIIDGCEINIYDTIGLEIDKSLNERNLNNVKKRIIEAEKTSKSDDINIIWYCINPNNSRFEDFEVDLIKDMIFDFEIPFIIVLTQSYSRRIAHNLAETIYAKCNNQRIITLLAETYETDAGIVAAYGVDDLLYITINDYNALKINTLVHKKEELNKKITNLQLLNEENIMIKKRKAITEVNCIIQDAYVVGCILVVSLFSMRDPYIKIIKTINSIFDIPYDETMIAQICSIIFKSILYSPLLAIPVVSGNIAKKELEDMSNNYLECVIGAVRKSENFEISNSKIMVDRIIKEIENRKRG